MSKGRGDHVRRSVGEPATGRFHVRFLKTVYGDTGHACEICQREIDLSAADPASARDAAARRFCDLEHIGDWSHHADRIEITEIATCLEGDLA